MIHYQLICQRRHEFDGWFKSSDSFEQQAERGLVSCPKCADTNVVRALMAPGIVSSAKRDPSRDNFSHSERPHAIPDEALAAMRRLRSEVETKCEYVGKRFATEVRKMAHGETRHRDVYGEATMEEQDRLRDEGIAFQEVPWVDRVD
jgi:hypothetical protein